MNDRFKFRFWDKETQTMQKIPMIELRHRITLDKIFADDRVIFMQCTALKDSAGKLIYEGDIVRFIYGNKKRLGYIEENKTVWSITNSNFCQGAWCGGALINLYETCEVIGNIYENPELLQKGE